MKKLNFTFCFSMMFVFLMSTAFASAIDETMFSKYNKSNPSRYKKTVPVRQVVQYAPNGYHVYNGYNPYNGYYNPNGYYNGYIYNITPPPIVTNRVTVINTQNGTYEFSDPEIHHWGSYYNNYYPPHRSSFSVRTNNVFFGN